MGTVTVAVGELVGVNVTPAEPVQLPIPMLGLAFKLKESVHVVSSIPAFALGKPTKGPPVMVIGQPLLSITSKLYISPLSKPLILIVPPLFAVVFTKEAVAGTKFDAVNCEPLIAGNPPVIVIVNELSKQFGVGFEETI